MSSHATHQLPSSRLLSIGGCKPHRTGVSASPEIYVICVNMPGYLPEMEPYAVKGLDMAWTCAHHELEDEDCFPESRAEFWSSLQAGGFSMELESGYILSVTPLGALGLPADDHAAYVDEATA